MNYSKYFITKSRDGEDFVCLDNPPKELSELVQEIHHSDGFDRCFPNDWIYSIIEDAFDILQCDDREIDEIVSETDADPYTYDLKRWFLEPYAETFVEIAGEEGLIEGHNIIQHIMIAQALAKQSIYYQVHAFLTKNKEKPNE